MKNENATLLPPAGRTVDTGRHLASCVVLPCCCHLQYWDQQQRPQQHKGLYRLQQQVMDSWLGKWWRSSIRYHAKTNIPYVAAVQRETTRNRCCSALKCLAREADVPPDIRQDNPVSVFYLIMTRCLFVNRARVHTPPYVLLHPFVTSCL